MRPGFDQIWAISAEVGPAWAEGEPRIRRRVFRGPKSAGRQADRGPRAIKGATALPSPLASAARARARRGRRPRCVPEAAAARRCAPPSHPPPAAVRAAAAAHASRAARAPPLAAAVLRARARHRPPPARPRCTLWLRAVDSAGKRPRGPEVGRLKTSPGLAFESSDLGLCSIGAFRRGGAGSRGPERIRPAGPAMGRIRTARSMSELCQAKSGQIFGRPPKTLARPRRPHEGPLAQMTPARAALCAPTWFEASIVGLRVCPPRRQTRTPRSMRPAAAARAAPTRGGARPPLRRRTSSTRCGARCCSASRTTRIGRSSRICALDWGVRIGQIGPNRPLRYVAQSSHAGLDGSQYA